MKLTWAPSLGSPSAGEPDSAKLGKQSPEQHPTTTTTTGRLSSYSAMGHEHLLSTSTYSASLCRVTDRKRAWHRCTDW